MKRKIPMLKRGRRVYRINRGGDSVFVTVWENSRLVDHGICPIRSRRDFRDYFMFRNEQYFLSEFVG